LYSSLFAGLRVGLRRASVSAGVAIAASSCAGAHRSEFFEAPPDAAWSGPEAGALGDGGVFAPDGRSGDAGDGDGDGGATAIGSTDAGGADGTADASAAGPTGSDAGTTGGSAGSGSAGGSGGSAGSGGDGGSGGSGSSGSPDAGARPTYTADACLATPSAYTVSCDPACRPINCRLIDCPMAPVTTWALNEQTMLALPWRFRTARATTETACGTRCGDATVAKGVVRFELDFPTPTNLTLSIGAPWRIAVNTRYALCVSGAEAAAATSSCISREFTKATITVFTTDPNAPPRDLVIDRFPRAYCTGTP